MGHRVNGRLAKLENFQQAAQGPGPGAATRRLIEIRLGMGYDPTGDWPTPDVLEALEVQARAQDPEFWRHLDFALARAYGD